MSVFSKLQQARIMLQKTDLKKSGLNKFAGFKYFELGDFLPTIQTIFADLKLSSTINFTASDATLTLVDTEDNSQTVFGCPVVVPVMKGCNEIQAMGAMITYIRRYLYVNALEIVENDVIDSVEQDGKGKGVHKPTDNASFKPEGEELELLTTIVDTILGLDKDYDAMVSYLSTHILDADEKVWVWDKLPSATRSGIKKANEKEKL